MIDSKKFDLETAWKFFDDLVFKKTGKHLTDIYIYENKENLYKKVFLLSWNGISYKNMTKKIEGYGESALKQIGVDLMTLLSEVLEIERENKKERKEGNNFLSKRTFRKFLTEKYREVNKNKSSESETLSNINTSNKQDVCTTEVPFFKADIEGSDPNFVGRRNAIRSLDNLIDKNNKIILIQALGGVGKTTLARKYLQNKFGTILEFPIAQERKDIASVESLLEFNLGKLGEETTGEFLILLQRLKEKLKNEDVGILIDNLETALDENGKFIEKHRSYVELLQVLSDNSLKSVTLITSRERIGENLAIPLYNLPSLTEEAWREYWKHQNIKINDDILTEIYKSFGGNALAMKVLCNPILNEFQGNIVAYWNDNKTEDGLIVETAVETLIKEQFERLKNVNLDAYNLLCRMGCYRYQDVPTVLEKGLNCLLWDVVEKKKQKRVIKVLKQRALVEFNNNSYWLHPVIKEEAIEKLRNSEYWEKTNIEIAEYFTKSIKEVNTIDDALTAFEAYYHYLNIEDYNKAVCIIINEKKVKYFLEPLDISFHRLGLLTTMINSVKYLLNKEKNIHPIYVCSLHESLGDLYQVIGLLHESYENHKLSGYLANKYAIEKYQILNLFNQGLCYIDFWDIKNAFLYFTMAEKLSENNDNLRYKIYCYFYLAFLYALKMDKTMTLDYIEKSLDIKSKQCLTSWGIGNQKLLLGHSYKKVELYSESFSYFNEAMEFSIEFNYPQVKGKALTGLGELYRIENNFDKALEHHKESIEILKKIGAKCDLAEAYFQLALTYQKIED